MSKLHGGYYLDNQDVVFYNLDPNDKPRSFMVDQDKVLNYEGMCLTYFENFMNIGWLRLHTPIERYQEELGTNFLSVPQEHRARVSQMLKGGRLIIVDFPNEFRVYETGKQISLSQLLGSGELIDLFEMGAHYRQKFEKGEISKEQFEKETEILNKTKFHIECFIVEGMFVQK